MLFKLKKRIPPLLIIFVVLYPKCIDYMSGSTALIRIIYILQLVIFTYLLFDEFVLKKATLNKDTWILVGLFIIFNLGYIISDLNARVLSQTLTINLRRCLVMIGLLIYVEKKKEKEKIEILKILFYYLSFLMAINIIGDFLFTNGIARMSMYSDEGYLTWSDSVGFLDADNRVSLFAFLYYYVANMYGKLQKHNRAIFLSYILIISNIIMSRSGSAIIALIILLMYQLIVRSPRLRSVLLSWKGLLLAGIFIGFFVSGKFEGILIILGKIFNKGVTLSGRTVIWGEAIKKIIKSPILGYGTLEGGAFFKIGTYTWYAHDQYLDLWLQGGIISLVAFFVIVNFLNVKLRLNKGRDNYYCFVSTIVAFLTIGIVEHFILRNYYQFWIFICISFALRNTAREK